MPRIRFLFVLPLLVLGGLALLPAGWTLPKLAAPLLNSPGALSAALPGPQTKQCQAQPNNKQRKDWHAPEPCKRCGKRFPRKVKDFRGRLRDLRGNAKQKLLVVIFLRSTRCRECLFQLQQLGKKQNRLQSCGMRFMVVAPGTTTEVRRLAHRGLLKAIYVPAAQSKWTQQLKLHKTNGELRTGILVANHKNIIVWERLKDSIPHDNVEFFIAAWKCYYYVQQTPSRRAG